MGYNLNQYGAIEGGYNYFAPSTYKSPSTVTCSDPSVRTYALDIEGKGTIPMANFGLYGKGGVAIVRTTSSGSLAVISVSIKPGAMAFTFIFLPANSFAADLVSPIIPAFEAA